MHVERLGRIGKGVGASGEKTHMHFKAHVVTAIALAYTRACSQAEKAGCSEYCITDVENAGCTAACMGQAQNLVVLHPCYQQATTQLGRC